MSNGNDFQSSAMEIRGRRPINHRQLEAFQAVIEVGTVTAAAERLYITQPAASRLIQDLEQALGLTLFERRRGRLEPTVEAQVLYEEVERSFTGLNKIFQTAEDIRTLKTGTLRIAAMPAMALGFLPRVIKTFSALHANVKISLQIRSSVKVMEWVASQQFDFGLAAVQHEHPAVKQELLLEAPFVAVLPLDHRLAAKRSIRPEDFENESFVSLGTELDVRSRVDSIFAEARVNRQLMIDTQLSAAVCRIVAQGSGVSLVEPITAYDFLERGEVITRPFRPELMFRYSVLFPVHRTRSKIAREFLELVKLDLRASVVERNLF